MKKLIFTIWMLVLGVSSFPTEVSAQWIPFNNGIANVYTLESDINFLLAGTSSGIYLSSDNGNNWIQRNNGLTNLSIYDLAICGDNLIAGTGSGVFLSTNHGLIWYAVTSEALRHFAVNGTIINASNGFSIFRSIDYGNNWTLIRENLFWEWLAFDEWVPSPITSIEVFSSILYAGSGGGGAAYSRNDGTTWTSVNNGIIKFQLVPPRPYHFNYPSITGFTQVGSNIYLGASGSTYNGIPDGGVYTRPMNSGSWMQINNNLFNLYNTSSSKVISINSESDNLFVGTYDGIYMTTNNGLYWMNKSQGLNPQSKVGFILFKDDFSFIIVAGNIWKRNITEMSSYNPDDVGTLAVNNPENGSKLYVGCDTGLLVYPKTTVKNFGSNNQTVPFEVFFEIKLENDVVFSNSVLVTLSSGLTHDISFAPYYIPENAVGKYNLKTWTKLLSDDNKLNDTSTAFINVSNPNYRVEPVQFSSDYYFANSSAGAACAPSQPIFYWEDTTGSTALILNGVPQIDLSEGDLDNGYFVIQNIFQQDEQFRFFGEYKNYFKISTNGIIGMGNNAVGISNSDPGPIPYYYTGVGPAFFPFWCDLDYSDQDINGRNLKYKSVGNRLIITYDKAPIKNVSSDTEDFLSFQIILKSSPGENGILTVQFDNNRSGSTFLNKYITNNLAPHTIGIQDWMGYHGVQYRYRNSAGEIVSPGPLFSSPLALSFGPDNSVLPVELISFTSSVYENNVTLNWQTNTESSNSGFDIERSNAKDQWSKTGFVQGNGNSNEPKDYSFTDNNLAPGKYKYRLKQIDYNGSFEYLNLAGEVTIGIPDKYELSQNYPNPFNPVTNLEFGIPVLGFVSLKVYDVLGKEVISLVNEIKPAGRYSVEFDGSNFASGVYFYELRSGEFVAQKRMLLLK